MEATVAVSNHGSVHDGAVKLFGATHHDQRLQPSTYHQSQKREHLLSSSLARGLYGGVASVTSKTCTAPLSRLTILFQVQGMHSDAAALSKASISREALRILNEEGFRAFWRGNLVMIVHRLPYSSVNFYAFESYKALLKSIPGLESHRTPSVDFFLHSVGGGIAGVAASSVAYPLDLVRTRLAAQKSAMYYRGIGHAFRTICRDEGVFGLYRGLGATLLQIAPSFAISFATYEMLKSSWKSHRPNDSTVPIGLACGALSGITASTATFPLDLVRRRKQLEGAGGRALVYRSGLYGTLRHILHAEGLRGLYRGILPEFYKVAPGHGITFMIFELLKKQLLDRPRDCY